MEYQTAPANDLKPGDNLLNFGKIKSVKLTAKEVTIVLQPHKEPIVLGGLQEAHTMPSDWYISDSPRKNTVESVLGYNEPMTIHQRAVAMTDLNVQLEDIQVRHNDLIAKEFGENPVANQAKVSAQKKKENK